MTSLPCGCHEGTGCPECSNPDEAHAAWVMYREATEGWENDREMDWTVWA
jgi:hypothetical protein